jgi:hypothetical protein
MLLVSRSGARAGASTRRASAGFRSTPALVAGAVVALLAACQDPAAPAGAATRLAAEGHGPGANASAAPRAGDVIPDEYIVTFRDDVADAPGWRGSWWRRTADGALHLHGGAQGLRGAAAGPGGRGAAAQSACRVDRTGPPS